MSPFHSLAALILSLLVASPALAAPETDVLALDPIDPFAAVTGETPGHARAAYWATSLCVPSRDLPIPASASIDTQTLFRALLLGRDVRSERAGQGDLVGLLPLLREEQRAEIAELRGDLRDPGDALDLRPAQRIGMR